MRKFTIRFAAVALMLTMTVQSVSATRLLVPVGQVIGLELGEDRVTVEGFDNRFGDRARVAGLKEGDQITKIDDYEIHCAEDVRIASSLIKSYGFSLGLQMMTGLYKSNDEWDFYTASEFIKLKPDTVRIYPTVVLKNTTLADLYADGKYNPPNCEESSKLCSKLIPMFESEGIKVIRVGLHDSESLRNNMIAGAFHPAFREICESQIYLYNILKELKAQNLTGGNISVYVPKSGLSKAIGQRCSNKNHLVSLGYKPEFIPNDTLADRQVLIQKG